MGKSLSADGLRCDGRQGEMSAPINAPSSRHPEAAGSQFVAVLQD
jgi:hypothetical protein